MGQTRREVFSTVPRQGPVVGAFPGAARNDEVGRTWAPPSAWYDEPGEPWPTTRGRLRACWSLCKHVVVTAFSCAVAALLAG